MDRRWLQIAVSLVVTYGPMLAAFAEGPDPEMLQRGRYLVKLGGCNDCHTPGYAMANGVVPEKGWLIGDPVGWNGPWGTTYAANVRKLVSGLTEREWMTFARNSRMRPPMPWYVLRDMNDQDLSAMYAFIRSLGPSDNVTPAYLPPGVKPREPYFTFVAPAEPPVKGNSQSAGK